MPSPSNTVDLGEVPPHWKNGVAVFCGSSFGNDPEFKKAAEEVGVALAERGYPLVYGGGNAGLMGVVSASCSSSSGRVHGFRPTALLATAHPETKTIRFDDEGRALEEDTIVCSMHERKMRMAHWAQRGFFVLPGGWGTLEEMAEMTTWTQLAIHTKPIIVLNVKDVFSPLRDWIQKSVSAGFIRPASADLMLFIDPPQTSSSSSSLFNWGKEAVKVLDSWWEKTNQHPAGSRLEGQFSLEWDIGTGKGGEGKKGEPGLHRT